MLYNADGTPTDHNLTLRGLLAAFVFVVLGALAVSNPAPWSPLGHASPAQSSTPAPTPTPSADGQTT